MMRRGPENCVKCSGWGLDIVGQIRRCEDLDAPGTKNATCPYCLGTGKMLIPLAEFFDE
jgi:hypothetical protein